MLLPCPICVTLDVIALSYIICVTLDVIALSYIISVTLDVIVLSYLCDARCYCPVLLVWR